MPYQEKSYYPTILKAIHLIVLYLFIQTIVDFPLALIDFYEGTNYLGNPLKNFILTIGSTGFILYYGFKKSGNTFKEVFPTNFFNLLIVIPLIAFFWGIQNLLGIINLWIQIILPAPAWFNELLDKIISDDVSIWASIFKVVIFAPIIEEMLFRGVILNGFRKNYSSTVAIILSALLFALFHLNPWQFPATFMLGLILGWLVIRTNSILLAIIGHAINNGLVLVTVIYWDTMKKWPIYFETRSSFYIMCFFIVVLSLALMYLLTKKSNKILKA